MGGCSHRLILGGENSLRFVVTKAEAPGVRATVFHSFANRRRTSLAIRASVNPHRPANRRIPRHEALERPSRMPLPHMCGWSQTVPRRATRWNCDSGRAAILPPGIPAAADFAWDGNFVPPIVCSQCSQFKFLSFI
jgi:hypothetical protein